MLLLWDIQSFLSPDFRREDLRSGLRAHDLLEQVWREGKQEAAAKEQDVVRTAGKLTQIHENKSLKTIQKHIVLKNYWTLIAIKILRDCYFSKFHVTFACLCMAHFSVAHSGPTISRLLSN